MIMMSAIIGKIPATKMSYLSRHMAEIACPLWAIVEADIVVSTM